MSLFLLQFIIEAAIHNLVSTVSDCKLGRQSLHDHQSLWLRKCARENQFQKNIYSVYLSYREMIEEQRFTSSSKSIKQLRAVMPAASQIIAPCHHHTTQYSTSASTASAPPAKPEHQRKMFIKNLLFGFCELASIIIFYDFDSIFAAPRL